MKNIEILRYILFSTLVFSCAPKEEKATAFEVHLAEEKEELHRQEAIQAVEQMRIQQRQAAATARLRPKTKGGKSDLAVVLGHYGSSLYLSATSKSYGVISLDAIDDESGQISFSTLFLGERQRYKAPFRIKNTGVGEVPSVDVNTDAFRFSSNGLSFSIALFDGIPQNPLLGTLKYEAFEYNPENEPKLGLIELIENSNLQNASKKRLLKKDLENLNPSNYEIMRQSIYAKHGAAFPSPEATRRFTNNPWYMPIFTMSEVEKKLTDIEIENLKSIKRYEKNAKPIRFGR